MGEWTTEIFKKCTSSIEVNPHKSSNHIVNQATIPKTFLSNFCFVESELQLQRTSIIRCSMIDRINFVSFFLHCSLISSVAFTKTLTYFRSSNEWISFYLRWKVSTNRLSNFSIYFLSVLVFLYSIFIYLPYKPFYDSSLKFSAIHRSCIDFLFIEQIETEEKSFHESLFMFGHGSVTMKTPMNNRKATRPSLGSWWQSWSIRKCFRPWPIKTFTRLHLLTKHKIWLKMQTRFDPSVLVKVSGQVDSLRPLASVRFSIRY